MKLTNRAVESERPCERDRFLWDKNPAGFGVKVAPSGTKTFIYQYRTATGRSRRQTLGRFPDITVEQARTLAAVDYGEVRKGGDPLAAKREKRAAAARAATSTIGALAKFYLADIADSKPSTVYEQRRIVDKYIVPVLGTKPLSSLAERDVRLLHRKYSDAPVMANRIVCTLRAIAYHVRDSDEYAEEFPAKNPFRNFRSGARRRGWKHSEESRQRFLSREEVGRLAVALDTAEREGLPVPPRLRGRKKAAIKRGPYNITAAPRMTPANPNAVNAIRYLMLTGCREREALTLKWTDINDAFVTYKETKTGQSVRSLGAEVLELLARQAHIEDNPYVFVGSREGEHLIEIRRVWESVRFAAGLTDVRLHDLRHSFASFGASLGYSLQIIGRLLGHSGKESITSRYAHLTDGALRQAADAISGLIARSMRGEQEDRTVLPFRQATTA